jgi:hypothetical protein
MRLRVNKCGDKKNNSELRKAIPQGISMQMREL